MPHIQDKHRNLPPPLPGLHENTKKCLSVVVKDGFMTVNFAHLVHFVGVGPNRTQIYFRKKTVFICTVDRNNEQQCRNARPDSGPYISGK